MCGIANASPRQNWPACSPAKDYQLPNDFPDDLVTIDVHAFTKLTDEDTALEAAPPVTPLTDPAPPVTPLTDPAPSATPLTELASPVTSLTDPAPPATPLASSATPVTDFSKIPVGEEIIRTCVTPSKVREVQVMLNAEKQRHPCAFFTKQELSTRNTDGTRGKESLDKNKLNCLKALVFAKFPTESSEEKDRSIKGKINTKCRANKLTVKQAIWRKYFRTSCDV